MAVKKIKGARLLLVLTAFSVSRWNLQRSFGSFLILRAARGVGKSRARVDLNRSSAADLRITYLQSATLRTKYAKSRIRAVQPEFRQSQPRRSQARVDASPPQSPLQFVVRQ